MTVFTLCSSTDFIQVLLYQAEKFSISLIEQFKITMDRSRKLPNIAMKRLIRKKYRGHYLSFNEELASTQTHGSMFLDRNRKNLNSKFEINLLKIIDCFIDCHGSVNSDYVSFVINELSYIVFLVVCPDKSLKIKLWFRNT